VGTTGPLRNPRARAGDPAAPAPVGAVGAIISGGQGNPPELSVQTTVTVKEAAFRLGKSQDSIYHWLRSGRLRGWQPGGRCCSILVLEASVQEALRCSVGTAEEPRQKEIAAAV
jgi:excisionase family DNA binding protein